MARTANYRTRVQAPRRRRVWASQVSVVPGITNTAVQVADLLGAFETAYGAQMLGVTIGRTFVSFRAQRSTAGASAGGLMVGIIKSSASLDNVDLAPLDSQGDHLDWSMLKTFYNPVTPLDGYISGSLDVKSMRKLDELGDNYRIVFQAVEADTYNVQFHARTLLLLP